MKSALAPRIAAAAAAAALPLFGIADVADAIPVGPVNYVESVSGDLPDGFNPGQTTFPLFSFQVGSNTISGRFGDPVGSNNADFDGFAFNVPSGTELVSGTVTLSDFIGQVHSGTWYLNPGSTPNFSFPPFEQWDSDSPGSASLQSVPLASGSYSITPGGFATGGEPAFSDYVFTFNVQPVPEPATIGLLGVAGAALLRRRRRQR